MKSRNVLRFWFGWLPLPWLRTWWFKKDPRIDSEIRRRFGTALAAAVRGELDTWKKTPRGRLALIILLDQFSRNIYRDDARAFAADEKALALAREGIEKGDDKTLGRFERMFFYMPFMHSESPEMQEKSVELFTRLGIPANIPFAKEHKRLIDVYGRFPHRNKALGRESTPEEKEYLSQPGAGF